MARPGSPYEKSDDPSSPSTSDVSQVESFSNYSVDKVNLKLDESFMVHPIPTIFYMTVRSFIAFKLVITKEVEDLITATPYKHCLLDPIPALLVKNCALLLLLYQSQLFKRLLAEG